MANQNHFFDCICCAIVAIAARHGESSMLKSKKENAAIALGNHMATALSLIHISWQEKVKEPVRFHALLADELKKDPVFQGMSTQQIKALWIASRIRAMHEEGRYDWKDFVVLVRSNRRKDDLRAAFDLSLIHILSTTMRTPSLARSSSSYTASRPLLPIRLSCV